MPPTDLHPTGANATARTVVAAQHFCDQAHREVRAGLEALVGPCEVVAVDCGITLTGVLDAIAAEQPYRACGTATVRLDGHAVNLELFGNSFCTLDAYGTTYTSWAWGAYRDGVPVHDRCDLAAVATV